MNTGEIILLVLGVIIIVLAVKGKPLYQFLVKLGNSRAFPYLIFGGGILLILGLTRFWGLRMDIVIGTGFIVGLLFAVLFLDPERHKD